MISPVLLIILDGWGIAPNGPGNAISLAKLPFYNDLLLNYPHCELQACGEAVGLPRGEVGNTETGHLNLGAGSIVYQDLPRINLSIADGSFFKNPAFSAALDHARKYQSNFHLLGLIGSSGVHSSIEHLFALLQFLKEQEFKKVYLHLITDGRDSPPKSALIYIKEIQAYLSNLEFGQIATIMGRYYAMDRDNRWERTARAYKALTSSDAQKADSAISAIENSYGYGITDEFILPTILNKQNKPLPRISATDSVIFFNYRIDRPRQLTKAFVLQDFENQANLVDFDPYTVKYFKKHEINLTFNEPFARGPILPHLYFVTMTEYSRNVHASSVAYPPHVVVNPLSEIISNYGLFQLHMSESEKERFVTYYFNGLREIPFVNQDNVIVASKKVATYDLQPEMSALELSKELISMLNKNKYHFLVVNFANPDMVGHTGSISATIAACETIDYCLSQIIPVILKHKGTAFITADHGNAEELINKQTNGIDTEHSKFPVPFIAVNSDWIAKKIPMINGILADVAVTILHFMKLAIPKSMTGRNLLENALQ